MQLMSSHPCSVTLVESFQTEELLCLVMEYLPGGTLFDLLVRSKGDGGWKDEDVLYYAASVRHMPKRCGTDL